MMYNDPLIVADILS